MPLKPFVASIARPGSYTNDLAPELGHSLRVVYHATITMVRIDSEKYLGWILDIEWCFILWLQTANCYFLMGMRECCLVSWFLGCNILKGDKEGAWMHRKGLFGLWFMQSFSNRVPEWQLVLQMSIKVESICISDEISAAERSAEPQRKLDFTRRLIYQCIMCLWVCIISLRICAIMSEGRTRKAAWYWSGATDKLSSSPSRYELQPYQICQ